MILKCPQIIEESLKMCKVARYKLKVKRWALFIIKVHCIGESLKKYIEAKIIIQGH